MPILTFKIFWVVYQDGNFHSILEKLLFSLKSIPSHSPNKESLGELLKTFWSSQSKYVALSVIFVFIISKKTNYFQCPFTKLKILQLLYLQKSSLLGLFVIIFLCSDLCRNKRKSYPMKMLRSSKSAYHVPSFTYDKPNQKAYFQHYWPITNKEKNYDAFIGIYLVQIKNICK